MFVVRAAHNRLRNTSVFAGNPASVPRSCFRPGSYFRWIRFLRNLAIIHLFCFGLTRKRTRE
jgi:hypothetical protein